MRTLRSRRRLRPRPAERTVSAWKCVVFLIVVFACGALLFGLMEFVVFVVLFGVLLLGLALAANRASRLRDIAASRPDDSICTFARALDYRSLDTVIIRAVYEELQEYFSFVSPAFHIRPTDKLESDLQVDPEDTEEMAKVIAARTNRTLDGCEANPFYGRVHTPSDLIQFFNGQPVVESR
jgi:hypothetical protein